MLQIQLQDQRVLGNISTYWQSKINEGYAYHFQKQLYLVLELGSDPDWKWMALAMETGLCSVESRGE